MKRNYALLVIIFLLHIPIAKSQVVATNDNVFNANAVMGGLLQNGGNFPYYLNVLQNDNVDGGSPYQTTTISTISSSNPGITLVGNQLHIATTTPPGTYTLVYQLCRIANPSDCDTATVTVEVCNQPAPTAVAVDPDCSSSTGSVTLSGLPAGNWTISKRTYFGSPQLIAGSGNATTIANLAPDGYYFKVISDTNCQSPEIYIQVTTPSGMLVDPVGTYQDFNGNGVTDAGDIVNWQINITNTLSCPLTNIDVTYFSLPLNGGPVTSIAGGTTNSALTAVQVLTQEDITQGDVSFYLWLSADSAAGGQYGKFSGTTSLNIADGIKLNAFIDTDGNGLQNGTEPNFTYGTFHYERNNDGAIHNVNTESGIFNIYETNPVNTFDISFDTNISCSASYTVSPSAYNNVVIAIGSGITTYNFPITVVPCTDLTVYLSRRETARPGETYSHWVSYYNSGNQPIANATITFTCDPAVTVTSVSVPGAVVTPTGFTYNVANLLPSTGEWFYVTMSTPPSPTVELGDLLTSTVSITVPPGDVDIANNSQTIVEEVTNAYDPNDISESHGPSIVHSTFTAQDYLTYMIRFENTGNANAINIRVENILNDKLDPDTVQMVDASHEYVLDRVGNTLEWTFIAVSLPPSVPNSDVGKGYILFNIKPKTGYAVGDIIPAQASIYFDTNPAITTSTFNTEFVSSLGRPSFDASQFTAFPNPVKNTVRISNNENIERVEVYTVLGQLILQKSANASYTDLDASDLKSGVYLLKAYSGNQEKTFRIIKE